MLMLALAKLVVATVPFRWWRNSLGRASATASDTTSEGIQRLTADLSWAAHRFPFDAKCLPRAMALSWILRSRKINHAVVIAVRPRELRVSADALHAWIEVDGRRVLGDLAGPWIEAFRSPVQTRVGATQ